MENNIDDFDKKGKDIIMRLWMRLTTGWYELIRERMKDPVFITFMGKEWWWVLKSFPESRLNEAVDYFIKAANKFPPTPGEIFQYCNGTLKQEDRSRVPYYQLDKPKPTKEERDRQKAIARKWFDRIKSGITNTEFEPETRQDVISKTKAEVSPLLREYLSTHPLELVRRS